MPACRDKTNDLFCVKCEVPDVGSVTCTECQTGFVLDNEDKTDVASKKICKSKFCCHVLYTNVNIDDGRPTIWQLTFLHFALRSDFEVV